QTCALPIDGTVVTFDANTTTIIDNEDGSYTITNADGTTSTIDTRASTNPYDNTNSGMVSDNVQDAIDELSQTIETNKGNLTVSEGIEFTGGLDGTNILLADSGIGVADGGISTDKLADGAVSPDKIQAGAADQIMITNAAGEVQWVNNADFVEENQTVTTLGINAGSLVYDNEDATNSDVILISADPNNILTAGSDGALFVDPTVSENIYNTDGVLTSSRLVQGTESWLISQGTNGSVQVNGNNLRSINGNGGITDLYYSGNVASFVAQGTSEALAIRTHDTQGPAPIIFSTSEGSGHLSNDRMIIAPTGEIGIGTSDPTELLDVAEGNVRVRDINTNVGTHTDHIVVADSEGVLKTVSAAAPKWFYMPSIVFDVSSNSTGLSRNLHQEYLDQYGTPQVSSAGASGSIPTFAPTELEYYVTYYDTAVFANVSIDANGVLSYDVINTNPTGYSFMNIVFVVK